MTERGVDSWQLAGRTLADGGWQLAVGRCRHFSLNRDSWIKRLPGRTDDRWQMAVDRSPWVDAAICLNRD